MAWIERSVEQMREEFVKRVLSGEKTKSALCREYGISCVTGDKWLKRYIAGEPLTDRSREPFNHPNRISAATEAEIVNYRQSHPAFGAVKIRRFMENDGYTELPCVKTYNNIFICHRPEVEALGKEKPNDIVRVLVSPTLPRLVRLGKVDEGI